MPDPYPNPSTEPVLARAYQHANFQGNEIVMGPGIFNYNDLTGAGLHDRISSLKVMPGAEVRLYRDVSGGAAQRTVLDGDRPGRDRQLQEPPHCQ